MELNLKDVQMLMANQVNDVLREVRDVPVERKDVRRECQAEDLANAQLVLWGIQTTLHLMEKNEGNKDELYATSGRAHLAMLALGRIASEIRAGWLEV
jgi:hypothetical protein